MNLPNPKPNNWLLQHCKDVTSQLGEDGILEKVFEIIPDRDRWCVEFGAADGKEFSNTYNLINNHGWSSVQIEANPKYYQLLSDRHKNNPKAICLNKKLDFEGENTLDRVLSATPIPVDFDFLSIDVDGNDYHIWNSIEIHKPKVICIEFNPTIPHYIAFIQAKNWEIYQGSSLLALQRLGKNKEYELIASTHWNGIFVRKEYFPLFEIQDNNIWKMNGNFQYWTYVFQLYDGNIVVGGYNKLHWHEIEVDLEQIQEFVQILPPEERQFPYKLS